MFHGAEYTHTLTTGMSLWAQLLSMATWLYGPRGVDLIYTGSTYRVAQNMCRVAQNMPLFRCLATDAASGRRLAPFPGRENGRHGTHFTRFNAHAPNIMTRIL